MSTPQPYIDNTLFHAGTIIIAGHYGAGKTNFSLNLALHMKKNPIIEHITLIDLDIVNPYFRSSDYLSDLNNEGIEVIAPIFARSMLDTPSLPGSIPVALSQASPTRPVIVDVGGDDEGAKVLARFARNIQNPYEFLYLINARRNLTQSASECLDILHEIEQKSSLKATALVNNTNLGADTTFDVTPLLIRQSQDLITNLEKMTQLPCVCTTVPQGFLTSDYYQEIAPTYCLNTFFEIKRIVHLPWE